MDKFTYEARDNTGQIIKGMVEADSQESAEDILKFNQLHVISMEPFMSAEERVVSFFVSFFRKVKIRDKAVFARQLATMINAGLPLMEALKYLAYKQPISQRLTEIIKETIAMIEKGKSFSFALSQYPDVFSSIFVSMVKSGEASGKLDKVLNELAEQLENDYTMRSKIRGAMIYPGFILCAVVGVGIFALIYIIPQMKSIFEESGMQLPLITLLLIKISTFVTDFWYIVILAVIIFAVFLRIFLRTDSGKVTMAYIALKLPIFSKINRDIYITNFARTLSLLMSGGVPIVTSLTMVNDAVGNVLIERELKEAVIDVEKGIPLSTPLSNSKFFPPIISSMVAVGEQTGELDKILLNIARMHEEEANNMLKGLTSLLEPMIMLIVGVGVAFLAVAVIMPIYQLSSSFI